MELEKIIDIKLDLDISLSELILIYLIHKKDNRYENLITKRVEDIMIDKGYIKKVDTTISLMYTNKKVKLIINKLEEKDLDSFNKLLKEFRKEYSRYRGVTSDGNRYKLLSNLSSDKRELALFKERNPDIDNETIYEALLYYIRENADMAFNISYAPKSSSFIGDTENKEYLIQYCYAVKRRKEKEKKIREAPKERSNFIELI